MTEVITNLPEGSTSVETDSAPSEQQETFRGRLRRGAVAALNALDLGMGVALNRIDARAHTDAMTTLNERYNGLLERRSASDRISAELQSDIQLDFRRDAQRAGFTDVQEMPTDQRRQIAEAAVATYIDEISAELQVHHPDWDADQIDQVAHQYAEDIATILSMDKEDHDTYLSTMLEYQESRSALAQLETEVTELQEQRNQHLRNFGRIALQTLVAMSHSVRNAPYAIGARSSVAIVQVRQWYGNRTVEGKRAVWFSAAGVAVAGIVAYLSARHTGVHGGNMTPVGYTLPDTDNPANHLGGNAAPADLLGNNHPADVLGNGGHPADVLGNNGQPADVLGNNGAQPADVLGNNPAPADALGGNGHPASNLGGNAQPSDTLGNNPADNLGNNPPQPANNLGNNHPADVLGNNPGAPAEAIKSSHDLFTGSGKIDAWPDTITVSHWNSKTHDGSCWGIAEQMLHRSGIDHPTNAQIQQVSDALRPQAQLPNGFLADGQTLHLGPALDVLSSL